MSLSLAVRVVAGLLAGLSVLGPAQADPLVLWVTNSNNFGAGSFSAALAQLQPVATPQEIRFSFPSGQTIYLNGPQAAIVGSDVRIDGADMFGNVVIDGAGWTPVTVAAATPHDAPGRRQPHPAPRPESGKRWVCERAQSRHDDDAGIASA
ncbi:MAG: hypothetical protein LKM39_13165 [Chiayiivirga sp.]|jgi:hypothetical protein|nr:hypothetical protein [Chiayiivirga sp.]